MIWIHEDELFHHEYELSKPELHKSVSFFPLKWSSKKSFVIKINVKRDNVITTVEEATTIKTSIHSEWTFLS